jgi:DNA-binding MarR family transcriptional regulator
MGERRYVLEDQVGFLLRKANQRHRSIFTAEVGGEVAPPQFSVLVKLSELGPTSQNQLGRLVALDSATMAGVIKRLRAAGLVDSSQSVDDARLRLLALTDDGREMVERLVPAAERITDLTLAPLNADEARTLARLLARIAEPE